MLWVCIKIRWSACTHPHRSPTLPTMAQPSQTSSEQSEQATDRRVSVVEASTILSITPDTVRSRLRRGTLRKDRGPDGEVLVVLDGDASATDRPTDQPTIAGRSAGRADHLPARAGGALARRGPAQRSPISRRVGRRRIRAHTGPRGAL